MMVRALSLASLLVVLGLAACAPRLTPTYRDFEVRAVPADSLVLRLEAAAAAAGWDLGTPLAPGTITTAERTFSKGFASRVRAVLDLVPLDGGFVRVTVRAESRSFLGGRTKVYALDGELRQSLLRPVSEALAEQGLVPLGTPRDRDEERAR
jgi:hypothetical protein